MNEKVFEDSFGLKDNEAIPCDYECPRCGGPIIHKVSDYSKVPMFGGDEMHWYICRAETCDCSWFPKFIKNWNDRPKEQRDRIRYLREQVKIYEAGLQVTIQDIFAELDSLGADRH